MSQNKAFSTPFILAVLCIYFSYFLHGISVITLAQNMTSLAEKFSTDNAGIAYLISGIGLGRLISILFFGVISDKFGRRAVILMAVIMYLLFFFGIPACPNLTLAYCLAVCVGIANSALDTGGYPALMECFPKASGSAVILVKAMVSFGQMFYPMLVSYMLLNNIWYGYGLIIPGILFVLITLMLLKSKFPSQLVDASVANELPQMNSKPLVWLEGVSSVLFGVAAFSTFYVIVVWMPKYAMAFAGMSEAEALKTISYYSMGSLVCVFIFAALLKKMVRPIWANVFNSALATITAAIIYLYPSPLVCNAGAFVIGFSAAGGILQLGVSVMSEFFPKSKAKVTSIYMMMGGLANFVIPLITGYLSNIGLQYIIVLDFTFALLALITAKYELIGLMAYPIRHSLSPEMQNKALEKAGLPFTYMAFEVDNDSFPAAIEGLKALKMRGTGVSMPNKQLACEYVDELTPAAKLVGAINTIVNDDGYLRGYNTDGTGHIRAIKESGFDIKGKTMVLLGAGGASTAIGAQGAIEGLKEIKLFNRRDEFFDKALAFAQRVNENTDCVVTVTDLADQQAFAEALASADILTNGTKVGMKPLENESLVNDISLLHPGLLVTECVYNPHMTKLLQQAQQAGCKTIDGYGMLLWQGAEQFSLWTGKDFPLEYVKQVMGFGA